MKDPWKVKRPAEDGELWICAACSKKGKTRETIGDESCYIWGRLCDNIVLDENGKIKSVKLVKDYNE